MEELTIEEKAKRYDEVMGRAKKELDACGSQDCDAARQIFRLFSELNVSKDEGIRKEIINYFECQSRDEPTRKDIHNKWIAWLEKQGNPTEINPSEFDLRLNKLLKQFETLPKEELASSLSFYLNVVQNDGTYKEEKQGEQKHANKVEPKDYNGIDPYFGKPIDKVEPKFKVGDWVVENGVNGNPVQITSFEEDKGVGIKVWFSNGTGTWVDYLKGYHKWTIEDAKDGDVLADNLGVILFKSMGDNNVINFHAYFSGLFAVQKDEENWGYAVNCTLSPATKEQRERFFAAMHDAGFEWDAEKRELKKISQRMISAEAKEAMYGKSTAWSEEDEEIYSRICHLIHSAAFENYDVDEVGKELGEYAKITDWLKAIKTRCAWKPNEEQIDALEQFISEYKDIDDNSRAYPISHNIESLYNDLKKLTE